MTSATCVASCLSACGRVLLCAAIVALGACQRAPDADKNKSKDTAAGAVSPAGTDKDQAGAAEHEAGGPPTVMLKPEQIKAIGIVTAPLATVEHRDEVAGYGVVLPHDTLAQPVAELRTAQAVAQQSHSALARAQSLAGSPGAVSADTQETAARQASVDAAALALAEQRLATVLGPAPTASAAERQRLLEKLASGRIKLVRATYPLGALNDSQPRTLRAIALAAQGSAERGWNLTPVWPAPADVSFPGRSFFAVLDRADVAEGQRLLVYAPSAASRNGVEVPLSAVVMSEGKYWCYVEAAPGKFVRTEIATDAPTAGGYFETTGLKAGEQVVTAASGQLLAQESNSGDEPD
jgi:hypothetical protein